MAAEKSKPIFFKAKTENETKTPTITIVLDIDNVLAIPGFPLSDSLQRFFLQHGAAFNVENVSYCIMPGVVELLKWLYQQENVNVAFFSSGTKDRNEELIKQLLIKVFGETKYEKPLKATSIRSRSDCVKITDVMQNEQYQKYELWNGSKKNLQTICGNDVSNAFLVDDDPSKVYPGQEKNFVNVPSTEFYSYKPLFRECSHSHSLIDFHDMWVACNGIYYIAGILNKIINDKKFDREELFLMQFNNSSEDYSLKRISDIEKEYQLINSGLKLLQEFNSKLVIVNQENYRQLTKAPSSKDEREKLEKETQELLKHSPSTIHFGL